jgi:predicted ATP-grasp superfamily ATP-dependent carboligase
MKPLIIGLGVNGWNVARALWAGGVEPVVIDNDRDSIFWRSRRLRPVHAERLCGPPLLRALREVVCDGAPCLLISATEEAVDYLNSNRDQLPAALRLDFPEAGTVSALLDKKEFHRLARSAGCAIYPMYFFDRGWNVEGGIEQVKFPCILKTRRKMYVSGLAKAYRISGPAELRHETERLARLPGLDPRDLLLQQWVPGGDGDVIFCLQYYGPESRPLLSFTGRKIRQWPPGTGGTASAMPVQLPAAAEEATRFFRSVNMRGLCSMEFKRSPADGSLSMIEPTVCRADYQEGTALVNGVNLPLAMYAAHAGLPPPPVREPPRPAIWVHVGPDYQSARKQGLTPWQWWRSLAGPKSYAVFTSEDVGPAAELLRRKLLGKWNRLLRR